jgi:lysophospholipase L1-like esterase
MILENVELYNVAELLEGGVDDVLDAEARYWFYGAIPPEEQVDFPQGRWFTRFPEALRRKLNPAARIRSLGTAGAEIRFNLVGEEARITVVGTLYPTILQVYRGCFHEGWQCVNRPPLTLTIRKAEFLPLMQEQARKHRLPYDPDLVRVVLPWYHPIKLLSIEGDVALPRPDQTPSRKMLFYGSSITHGNCSILAAENYPMKVGRKLGMDVLNFGLGAGAYLEPEMADFLADRDDWEMASLEMGINLIGSTPPEEFERRVDYFVSRIADAHPDQWIFCIDLFTCNADFRGDEDIGHYRRIVREKVQRMNRPRLVHLSGRELLPDPADLTTDLVHPSPSGMETIATNLTNVIRERTGA